MGILDLLRPPAAAVDMATRAAAVTGIPAFGSDSNHLATIVAEDILGVDKTPLSRALAMRVPAIAKGRALIVGTLSQRPLLKVKDGRAVSPDPWMVRTNGPQDTTQRMLWTLDDLIFHGLSLWLLQRGSRGELLDAARVPFDDWEITEAGFIEVNARRVSTDEACLFIGPQEGLLSIGGATIRGALAIENAWIQRAVAPVPLVELHVTDPNTHLTNKEKRDLAEQWESQRKRGGTAVTPYEIEMKTHGQTPTALYEEGRNALRLDIANYLNIPATMLDGSMQNASLNYSTTETRRNELLDYSLSYWAAAISARLSQDDIVPHGSAVEFDLSYLMNYDDTTQPLRKD